MCKVGCESTPGHWGRVTGGGTGLLGVRYCPTPDSCQYSEDTSSLDKSLHTGWPGRGQDPAVGSCPVLTLLWPSVSWPCSSPWGEPVGTEPLSSPVFSGMELFEEALQKWEQALSVGQRADGGSTPTPGDSLQNPDTSSEALSEVGGVPQSLQGWSGGWLAECTLTRHSRYVRLE